MKVCRFPERTCLLAYLEDKCWLIYVECSAINFLHLAKQWKSVGCCWKTSSGRKFQMLTDFCHSICMLSFSVQYKCLPSLLKCPGRNDPEAAVRGCDKTFLRSPTTYQHTAQLIWQSSLQTKWSGPPLTFQCTGSTCVQWRIRGSGHERFPTLTTSPKSASAVLQDPW